MTMTKKKSLLEDDGLEDALPPWKKQPHLYRDRAHLADVILDASETSGYYDGIPLSSPEELAKRRQRILDELRRRFPDD